MQLLGRYLSPFVRRVATTLGMYEIPFESNPLQHTGDDAPRLRALNPVGRVPALVLDNNEIIVDSAAIIDYLDREVGPDRALTPASGSDRTRVMSLTGLALGGIEKGVAVAYEARFRPKEIRHAPWVERCSEQTRGAFEHLDSVLQGDWLNGDKMTQADLTTAIGWQFMAKATPDLKASITAPRIDNLVERMMEMPQFKATVPE
ncbi:MAG: glutathione S-transferase [Gammaproteobacteria bacterium]|jgi:glutathione S-transferase